MHIHLVYLEGYVFEGLISYPLHQSTVGGPKLVKLIWKTHKKVHFEKKYKFHRI